MYMRASIIIAALLIPSFQSSAQEITRNNIYFEAGGTSFFYSINYERLLLDNFEKNVTARVGFMYLNYFDDRQREMKGIPISISYIHRIGRNFLELVSCQSYCVG